MQELSLNILDIAQNSVKAGATLVTIAVTAQSIANRLEIVIEDNGCGMDELQVKRVTDPFYTTRTTRKVGLGIPFFKMAAEMAGGGLALFSEPGKGTVVKAWFELDNIDRMPMGALGETVTSLIQCSPTVDFVLRYRVDDRQFVADTREFKAILESDGLGDPPVLLFIRQYLDENIETVNGGTKL